jgi:CheY-like chemotaxis protein
VKTRSVFGRPLRVHDSFRATLVKSSKSGDAASPSQLKVCGTHRLKRRIGKHPSRNPFQRRSDGSVPAETDLRPLRNTGGMMLPQQTLRCVIVDDNRAFMTIAALVLERDGVAVVATTTSSAGALACLERLRPEVVLVDLELGNESGLDLAKAIHRQSWVAGPAPAVILISARDERDFADRMAASPALRFLPKTKLSAAAISKSLAGLPAGDRDTKPAA